MIPTLRARRLVRRLACITLALATFAPPAAAQDGRQREADRVRERRQQDERRRASGRRGRETAGGARLTSVDTIVPLAERGQVDVSLAQGTIIVTAWERREVRVRATIDQGGQLGFTATPSRVSLDTDHPRGRMEARYEVTVPRDARLTVSGTSVEIDVRGVRGEVTVENVSGDVQLADVGGTITVSNMSGSLSLSGAEGDVRAEVQSGDIRLENVVGRVEVDGVSGNIEIVGSRARELRVETTSGNVTYDGSLAADGRYLIATHSGNVMLYFPTGTQARLDIESYNGEFVSDFPVTMQPSGLRGQQRRFDMLVGDGSGPTVRAPSDSGDIRLGHARARPRSGSTSTSKETP